MNTKRRTEYPKMRGIEAFLDAPEELTQLKQSIALDKIRLPSKQPRHHFDAGKMQQLVASIRQHGILEPLLVRPLDDDYYELVAGERRYRAAKEVGLTDAPVVIRKLNEQEAWQLALVENLQREDLNPVDETEGLLELLSISQGLSKEDAIALLNRAANAKKRGQELTDNVVRQLVDIETLFAATSGITAESFRSHRLPILNLPDELLSALRSGQLSYTKAKAIARLSDAQQRQRLLKKAINQQLSLSQIQADINALQLSEAKAVSLKEQVKTAYQKLQKSKCWNDPKRQQQIKKLLTQIEKILMEEPEAAS